MWKLGCFLVTVLLVNAMAETIPSLDGMTTYVCPDQETIVTAYANYCE